MRIKVTADFDPAMMSSWDWSMDEKQDPEDDMAYSPLEIFVGPSSLGDTDYVLEVSDATGKSMDIIESDDLNILLKSLDVLKDKYESLGFEVEEDVPMGRAMARRIPRVVANSSRYKNLIEKIATDFVHDPDAVKYELHQMKSGHAVFLDMVDFLTEKREMHRQGHIDLDRVEAGWSNVKNWGKDKFNKAVDWGKGKWTDFQNNLTDQATQFAQDVQNIPGQIQEAITPNWWSDIWNYQDPNALAMPTGEEASWMENWNFGDPTTFSPAHETTGLPMNTTPEQFLEQNPQMATDVPAPSGSPLDPAGYFTAPVDETSPSQQQLPQAPPDEEYANYFTAPEAPGWSDEDILQQPLPGIGYDVSQATARIRRGVQATRRSILMRGFKRMSRVLGDHEE